MLRITALLLFAALLVSCGVLPAETAPPLQQPFVLTADCSGSYTGSLRFSYTSAVCWCADYLCADGSVLLTVRCRSGELTLEQGALVSPLSAAVLPQHTLLRALCDAVTLCGCTQPQCEEESVYLYENERLRVRVKNGVVESVSSLADGSSCRITGFQLLSAPSD